MRIATITPVLAAAACCLAVPFAVFSGDRPAAPGADALARNLAACDTVDFAVFNNREWSRLHEYYAKDVAVTWPDGHQTVGIDKYAEGLRAIFVYAPDTRISGHARRFGSSTGEWTAVTGIMEGTFSQPMPLGNGKTFKPTNKTFRLSVCAIGHWKDGVIDEVSLFWDNMNFMRQIGTGK